MSSSSNDCGGVGAALVDVSIPFDFRAIDGFAIFYSNAPWAIPAVFALIYLTTRRISALIITWVLLLASGVNEIILVHISPQDRPEASCLDGLGMPSGHAALAAAGLFMILLEIIFSFYWSWPRKFWLILVTLCTFVPIGPFRTVINDHSWEQIGYGTLWGGVWAVINFVVIRFIIIRFAWEPLQCLRVARWLFQNDYDPRFKYSQFHGKMFKKHVLSKPKDEQHRYRVRSFHLWHYSPAILIYYGLIAFVNMILGVFGIIAGPVQEARDDTCDKASWPISIGVGIISVIHSVSMIILMLFLAYRMRFMKPIRPKEYPLLGARKKVSKIAFAKSLNPFRVIDLAYFTVFMWFQGLTWVICGLQTIGDCDFNITTLVFAIWLGINAIFLFLAFVIFVIWAIVQIIEKKQRHQDSKEEKKKDHADSGNNNQSSGLAGRASSFENRVQDSEGQTNHSAV